MSERKEDFVDAAQAFIDMFGGWIRDLGLGWLIDDPEPAAKPASPEAAAWDEGWRAAVDHLAAVAAFHGDRTDDTDAPPDQPVNPYREGS